MGEPIMKPEVVEDRALKKMLKSSDFSNECEIPRASVKRFPSNVSSFQRSQSSRFPSTSTITTPKDTFVFDINPNNPTRFKKTKPIDIATLLLDENNLPTTPVGPAPKKVPISRGIGRSYSNRMDTPTPIPAIFVDQSPPPPKPSPIRRQQIQSKPTTPSSYQQIPNGGGSFLYSGAYDPNNPNRRIITKPVPLTKSLTTNIKPMPKPMPKPRKMSNPRNNATPNNNINNNQNNKVVVVGVVGMMGGNKNRNPMAMQNASPAQTRNNNNAIGNDEIDIGKGRQRKDSTEFDNWADELYKSNEVKKEAISAKRRNSLINKPLLLNKNSKLNNNNMPSSSSPQQNWVLAGGPSKVSRNYNYRNSSSSDEDDETMGGMVVDVAKDEGKGFVIEGEINVEDFGDGMVSGMGGKLGEKGGGKLGGKLGKKLGNEEMGEEIGGMVGDEVGGMAADAGKEALG